MQEYHIGRHINDIPGNTRYYEKKLKSATYKNSRPDTSHIHNTQISHRILDLCVSIKNLEIIQVFKAKNSDNKAEIFVRNTATI